MNDYKHSYIRLNIDDLSKSAITITIISLLIIITKNILTPHPKLTRQVISRQNGGYFADGIFKFILLNENSIA